MDLLIIGGTQFVGRALTEAALARGWTVTLFNRGSTNPGLFPEVERLRGDRDGGLDPLRGRRWDAVIDTCGYVPRIVRQSAELLREAVGRYLFISTISVYDEAGIAGLDAVTEDAPLATLEDEAVEQVTGETYGGLKVLCERVVDTIYGERAINLRPGLIVGPHDHTHRFTTWPVRAARDADVLAPPADAPLQVIDVRDLADFALTLLEADASGAYNAVGPALPLTFGRVLQACTAAVGDSAARVHHADEAFLLQNGVQPWADLPLWLPTEAQAMAHVSAARSISAGLMHRPLAETVHDILAWYRGAHGVAFNGPLSGASDERLAELLAAWQRHGQGSG